jgi:hypothetical protein
LLFAFNVSTNQQNGIKKPTPTSTKAEVEASLQAIIGAFDKCGKGLGVDLNLGVGLGLKLKDLKAYVLRLPASYQY